MTDTRAQVNPKSTLLHLHIPKSGGSTLNKIIGWNERSESHYRDPDHWVTCGVFHYPGPHKPYGFYKEKDLRRCQPAMEVIRLHKLTAVMGHFTYGIHEHLITPFTYVTILRDPVDRIVSLFYHVRPDMSWRDFMERYSVEGLALDRTRLLVDNDQTRRIAGVEPPFGQCGSELLDIAKNNLERHFSLVGVTEWLEEFLVLLARDRQWETPLRYGYANLNPKRPSVRSLEPSIIELIESRNTLDMELYRFAKNRLAERIRGQDPQFRIEVGAYKALKEEWLEGVGAAADQAADVAQTAARVVSDSNRSAT